MIVLGLNFGHNCTACLLIDGKIVECVSEERFSRLKNQSGVPRKSIDYILKNNKLKLDQIDLVVAGDYWGGEGPSNFVNNFLNSYKNKKLSKRALAKLGYNFPNLFEAYNNAKNNLNGKKKTADKISRSLGISKNKVKIVDHHALHALSPCFNLSKGKKWIIFTLDGEGEGTCATVNIYDGKNLKVISRSFKKASLGYLYALATFHLGMKPLEHEFKLMGLAPYAKKDKVNETYEKIKDIITINENLEFQSKFNMPFSDIFFKKEFSQTRFDNFAGAIQKLTEELVCKWIKMAIEKTGIHNVALSGGVFMNVKANQKISEMPEVHDLFVMPSCGDESNAIGACFYGYKHLCEKNKKEFKPIKFEGLYLGPEYGNDYVEKLIKRENLDKRYFIEFHKQINKKVAQLLSKGEIVARCSGKSEWGARALGNRSILANPKNQDTIRILNETIKDRDFWMPFTPSVLDSYEKKYVINPKNIFSPYMALTFDSTERAKKDIPAAMHPYDFTIRPQIVTKEYNKDYYEVIKHFSELTKIGALLNTSFNLHGEPNVLTPEDAIHTTDNSSIKYLAIENYLFKKK